MIGRLPSSRPMGYGGPERKKPMIDSKTLGTEIEQVFRGLLGQILLYPAVLNLRVQALTNQVAISGRCHKDDMGRVIGEKRKNFTALERVAEIMGERAGIPVHMYHFDEPNPNGPQLKRRATTLDIERVVDMVDRICILCAQDDTVATKLKQLGGNCFAIDVLSPGYAEMCELNQQVQTILDSIGRANGEAKILLDLRAQAQFNDANRT